MLLTIPTMTLKYGGLMDAAACLPDRPRAPSLRAPPGATLRTDQIPLPPPLMSALTACHRIDSGDLSDHAAVTVMPGTALIDPAQIPSWY